MSKFNWDDDTVSYFSRKLDFLQDTLIEEVRDYVENNCEPKGIETYEQMTDDLWEEINNIN
jgi:hypothetical protein